MSSSSSEGSKYSKLDGLFDGISLGLEYVIILGSPVRYSVGASFCSYEVFKYVNLDCALNENPMGGEVGFYPVVES